MQVRFILGNTFTNPVAKELRVPRRSSSRVRRNRGDGLSGNGVVRGGRSFHQIHFLEDGLDAWVRTEIVPNGTPIDRDQQS